MLLFADPDVARGSPDADKILIAVGLTISEVAGVDASHVTVWFAEARRLATAAARRLPAGALEVEYGIDVPAESAAAVPDVGAIEASLGNVDVSYFTSLLQQNVDSNVGEDLYSVQVLAITSYAIGAPDAPLEVSDDTESSSSTTVIYIIVGVAFFVGLEIPILALCWRMRRRANQREASRENQDQLPEAPGLATHEHGQARVESGLVALGSVVELQGFRTNLHLNGHRGKVIKWMPDSGRYVIELADGTVKAIWPGNLMLVDVPPPHADDVRIEFDKKEEPRVHPSKPVVAPFLASADDALNLRRPHVLQPRSVMLQSQQALLLDLVPQRTAQ